MPGIQGPPGLDGYSGEKGEKGEPAEGRPGVKGQKVRLASGQRSNGEFTQGSKGKVDQELKMKL